MACPTHGRGICFDRFPQQQPFELLEELVCFTAAQLRLDARLIELYRKRQPTISEHHLSLLEHVSPIGWDNVVLISSIGSSSASAVRAKRVVLSV